VNERTPELRGLFDALVTATERLAKRTGVAVEVRPGARDGTLTETAPPDPHDPRASESASP